jgi:UDP-N-acetylglucosamine--N-acetylmuramyl-(pentapeptide) pyrophosphoryl-undecaprenol N-acetylglucosamine transferase
VAYDYFKFSPDKKTLLIVGGSLGARTINQSVIAHLKSMSESGIQVIWQTGKFYIEEVRKAYEPFKNANILVTDFVTRMDYAYAVADVVISRAGASSISELCLLGKPTILVPSPNVAEDHQTKNAMALVKKDAAVMITDATAREQLIPVTLNLIADDAKCHQLTENILKLAENNASGRIVNEILKLLNDKRGV